MPIERTDPRHPLYSRMEDHELRKSIEDKLAPLDFEQMLFSDFAEQEVPIRDKLKVTFRTINGLHSMWLEERIAEAQRKESAGGEPYSALKVNIWFLATAIKAINNISIGPDLPVDTRDAFYKVLDLRVAKIQNLPTILIEDLFVHYTWFIGRVRALTHDTKALEEALGNS